MSKLLPLLLGAGILFATIFLGSPEKIILSAMQFRADFIVPVVIFSLANYFARFIRWEIFLKSAGVKIGTMDSILVFLSAFLYSIAPAKSGDLVKAYYLKKRYKKDYSATIPIVVLERVYDVFGIVLLLALSGAIYFRQYAYAFALVAAAVILVTFFMGDFARVFLNRIRLPIFTKQVGFFKKALLSQQNLFSKKVSFASLFLGTLAWFFECLGLYLVVLGFGIAPGVVRETVIYSASTLGGAVSMLPGGLGATEGGMSMLLSKFASVPISEALSITLVIRAFTLWLAVLLGFFASLAMPDKGQKKKLAPKE